MKTIANTILTAAIFGFALNSSAQGKYTINGTITNLNNGYLYLAGSQKIDSVKVTNGKFIIHNELKEPVGNIYFLKTNSYYTSQEAEKNTSIYIVPATMKFQLDYNDFSKSKLTGSPIQDQQYEQNKITDVIKLKYKAEFAAYDEANKKYTAAVKAKADEVTLEKLKYAANDAREKLSPMFEENKKVQLQFIQNNPKSYLSFVYLMYSTREMNYDQAFTIYNGLNPIYKNTSVAKMIEKDIEDMKKGVPGAVAGDFDTTDINGSPLKLADFKGKYLLIDFWASWCVPCRKGNPHLISLFNKYHDKGLEILGVSDDDSNHDAWRKAVEKDQIGIWNHVLRGYDRTIDRSLVNPKDISGGYNIHSLPTKILIDKNGIIIGRYDGGETTDEEMDKKLAEIFKQ